MATSYTSLLGLALPVTGELAGTWGDTVNNSITSLLDTAVAGTTTLSTDADVTLTTTTGATNQARQAILLCSGARTATRNITAPAQSKIYAVVNNTTGGYAVVIRGAGPTTGVTVANGKTAVVVWNGADFVEVAPAVATNLSGGAAGSLPYQTGASATTFLSIGAADYVLTSTGTAPTWTLNTGTGNVVRATSPTITTPTIATSATVPLLIGGTGTTSTLALRSTSGVGTTGADIIFQTGNNGATEVMRILNSGVVGIGIAARNATFEVSRNSEGTYLKVGGDTTTTNARALTFTSSTASVSNGALHTINASSVDGVIALATASTERMRITSAGRVGVATTTPLGRLDVSASGGSTANAALTAVFGADEGDLTTRTNATTKVARIGYAHYTTAQSPAAILTATSNSTDNLLGIGGGTGSLSAATGILFYTAANNTTLTGSERMRIDSSGNVLVGATAQVVSERANITGATNTSSSGVYPCTIVLMDTNAYNNTNPSPGGGISFGYRYNAANAATLGPSIQGFKENTTDGDFAAGMKFFTRANGVPPVERMRIDSSGNVGIGIASDSIFTAAASTPVVKIRDLATAAANVGGAINFQGYTNGTTALNNFSIITGAKENGTAANGAGYFSIQTSNSAGVASERMRIDSSGNVAVGTTSPLANTRLHVQRDATANYTTTYTPGTTPTNLVLRDLSDTATYTTPYSTLSFGAGSSGSGWSYITGGREGAGTSFMAFGTGTASTATERMRINSTGNLLIGGTSPQGNSRIELLGTDDATSTISLYRSDSAQRTVVGAQYIGTFTNTNFDFYTNSTQKMRLAAGGQLLLGTSTGSALAQNYIDINATSNCGVFFKATDVTQGYVYADDAADEFRLAATGASNVNKMTFYTGGSERMRITSAGNVSIGGTANRATTVGTAALNIFNGTAPAGTLTNGISIYSNAGEAYVMDAAGNATLFSPHDAETNEWIFKSKHTPTGKVLKIDVEKMLRFINDHFGLDAIHEFTE